MKYIQQFLIAAILPLASASFAQNQAIGVARVTASSSLPDEDQHTYLPGNTIDGKPSTAWFPRQSDNHRGDWIRFQMVGKPVLSKLVIVNGWAKDDRLWFTNGRVAKATLTFSDDSRQAIELPNSMKPVEIPLPGVATEWVKLTIETSYSALHSDLGVSEVSFFGVEDTPAKSAAATERARLAQEKVGALPTSTEGTFVWSEGALPSNRGLVVANDLMWQDQPGVAIATFNWTEARQACAKLKIGIDGLQVDGFRLPTLNEYRSLFEGALDKRFSHFPQRNDLLWTADTYGSQGRSMVIFRSGLGTDRWQTDVHHARCVSDGGSLTKGTLAQLLAAIVAEGGKQVLPARPVRPVALVETPLVKGEFEPTASFQLRVSAEQDRVRAKNQEQDQRFELEARHWDIMLARQASKAQALDEKAADAVRVRELGKAFFIKFGAPKIKAMTYDPDAQAFQVDVESVRGGYTGTLNVPVPLAMAPDTKKFALRADFKPALEMHVSQGLVTAVGVRQLREPGAFILGTFYGFQKDNLKWLEESLAKYPDTSQSAMVQDRIDELQYKSIRDSLADLENFQRQRPKSKMADQVQARIKEIKSKQANDKVEESARQQRQTAERIRQSRLYAAAKNVGDQICREMSTGGLFGSDTWVVSAFVEGKSGNRIQIRIADPKAMNSYNGAKLYRGAIIWDEHNNWKACD